MLSTPVSEAPQCSTNTASDRSRQAEAKAGVQIEWRSDRPVTIQQQKERERGGFCFLVLNTQRSSWWSAVSLWVNAAWFWPFLSDLLTVYRFSAGGWDEEEEGGAHRPGNHELRESVSVSLMQDLQLVSESVLKSFISTFFRFVDVLKLLHIVSVAFIHLLEQPEDNQQRLWLLFEWPSKHFLLIWAVFESFTGFTGAAVGRWIPNHNEEGAALNFSLTGNSVKGLCLFEWKKTNKEIINIP